MGEVNQLVGTGVSQKHTFLSLSNLVLNQQQLYDEIEQSVERYQDIKTELDIIAITWYEECNDPTISENARWYINRHYELKTESLEDELGYHSWLLNFHVNQVLL